MSQRLTLFFVTEPFSLSGARINELPVEILCLIFGLCGDEISGFDYPRDRLMHHSANSPQDSQTYSEAIFTITRVCSRWSRVARSCPTLWTRIEMPSPRSFDYMFFRLCLKLSAGLPLTLRLNGAVLKDRSERPPARYWRSIIRRVAATAPRWKEISIRLTRDVDALDRLRTLSPGSFASLEQASIRLSMRAHDPHRSRPENDLWHVLCSSPSLRVEDFWDDARLSSLHIASSPLGNVTHLGLNKIRNNELKDILVACPRVEVLQVWLGTSLSPIDQRVRSGSIYALAIGTNFGAFTFTFSASLAGLLWRGILSQKGIMIHQRQFAVTNLPIILIAITTAGAALLAEVFIVSK